MYLLKYPVSVAYHFLDFLIVAVNGHWLRSLDATALQDLEWGVCIAGKNRQDGVIQCFDHLENCSKLGKILVQRGKGGAIVLGYLLPFKPH